MANIFALTWKISVLITLYNIGPCNTQNPNARPNVESYIHMESEMIDFFKYALREEERLHDGRDVHGFGDMYKFLDEVTPLNEEAIANMDQVTGDLTQIYALKRRLQREWAPMLELIMRSEFVKRVPLTLGRLQSMQYVIMTECDKYNSIIDDIFRIQHWYKRTPKQLLLPPRDVSHLKSKDVAHLVAVATDNEDYINALDWIKFGHAIYKNSPDTSLKKYFLNLKAGTYIKMYKLSKAEKIYSYLLKSDPSSKSAESNLRFVREKIEYEKKSPKEVPQPRNFTEGDIMRLCRGNIHPSRYEERQLKCYAKVIPDLEKPVLVEVLHDYPRIVMLRNFFSTAEVEYIKQYAHGELMNDLILDKKYTISLARLYSNTKIQYMQKFYSALRNITFQGSNVRRDDIIGDTDIQCDGPGGKQYHFHHQSWRMSTLELTLPIVNTFTFLSGGVTEGGYAFPDLHLRIEPDQGSVLLWQFKTQHGPVHSKLRRYVSCPVASGNQWVIKSTIEHRGTVRHINL